MAHEMKRESERGSGNVFVEFVDGRDESRGKTKGERETGNGGGKWSSTSCPFLPSFPGPLFSLVDDHVGPVSRF